MESEPPSIPPSLPTRSVESDRELYERLYRIARSQVERQYANPTLGASALVSEVVVKLGGLQLPGLSQEQFVNLSVRVMESIIIDNARRKKAKRRGGDRAREYLRDDFVHGLEITTDSDKLQSLSSVLEAVAKKSDEAERAVAVFRMIYFANMRTTECATAIGASEMTIRRAHALAKALIRLEFERRGEAL